MPTCRDHRVRGALNTCTMRAERVLEPKIANKARRSLTRVPHFARG